MKGLRLLAVIAVSVSLVAGFGCKKKEQSAEVAPPEATAPVDQAPQINVKKEDIRVAVPESVAGKWKDIKIEVMDKETKQAATIVVPIGGEAAIPGSALSVRAASFLPAFMMDGATITSSSNEPKNPAAQIVVTEGGREIHSGWLFTQFPTTHPFEHPKYGLTLVGFTPNS